MLNTSVVAFTICTYTYIYVYTCIYVVKRSYCVFTMSCFRSQCNGYFYITYGCFHCGVLLIRDWFYWQAIGVEIRWTKAAKGLVQVNLLIQRKGIAIWNGKLWFHQCDITACHELTLRSWLKLSATLFSNPMYTASQYFARTQAENKADKKVLLQWSLFHRPTWHLYSCSVSVTKSNRVCFRNPLCRYPGPGGQSRGPWRHLHLVELCGLPGVSRGQGRSHTVRQSAWACWVGY